MPYERGVRYEYEHEAREREAREARTAREARIETIRTYSQNRQPEDRRTVAQRITGYWPSWLKTERESGMPRSEELSSKERRELARHCIIQRNERFTREYKKKVEWLQNFNRQCNLCEIPYEMRLQSIHQYVDYRKMDFESVQTKAESWEEFCVMMQEELESERRSAHTIMNSIKGFQMRLNEDIREYNNRFKEMLEGMSEDDMVMRMRDICGEYVGGLTKDIYDKVVVSMGKRMKTATLSEIILEATHYFEYRIPHNYTEGRKTQMAGPSRYDRGRKVFYTEDEGGQESEEEEMVEDPFADINCDWRDCGVSVMVAQASVWPGAQRKGGGTLKRQ